MAHNNVLRSFIGARKFTQEALVFLGYSSAPLSDSWLQQLVSQSVSQSVNDLRLGGENSASLYNSGACAGL